MFATLPLFRKDLKLYRGPDDPDGSPTYNLLDPLKGQYYKINWKESLLLRHLKPGMSPEDLAHNVSTMSSIKITADDIEKFFIQASALDLVRIARTSEYFDASYKKRQMSVWLWILYHYLYIRLPVLNPDKFLDRTLNTVRPFASKLAFFIYAITTVLGLLVVINRWDAFIHTFTYFFNLQGIIFYAMAISVVKLIHEFSHAYVAKYYGLHVPTMGIAFIVLWPVLYTDVTDGWKLSKRSQRFAVSFAGIAAETIVAGLSTLGWALSSPGILQSTFFVLASTSWVSTLIINANPAVRFDGYYMLCDLWGIDNLQNRAFAVTRWKYLNWLFGIQMPCPEEGFSPQRITGMVIYTFYTWTYRLILYTAIAVFVYYEFTKALGILLFLAEILIFFIWPVVYEAKELYMVRSLFTWNRRSILTAIVAGLAAAWFIVPLPHRISFDAVVLPTKFQIVYAPEPSFAQEIHVHRGESLKAGDVIAKLTSKPLERDIAAAKNNNEMLRRELLAIVSTSGQDNFISHKQAQISENSAMLSSLLKRQNALNIKAEVTGTVSIWDDTLRVGQYLQRGAVLGKVSDFTSWQVFAYIPDRFVNYIQKDESVTVEISYPLQRLKGIVERIEPYRSEFMLHPGLASVNRGPLPSVEYQAGQPQLMGSYYVASVAIEENKAEPLKEGQLAVIRMRGPWRSKLGELIDAFLRLFLRESSL